MQPLTARPPLNRYVGEIISEAEAEMRQNDAYLFSLDDKVKIMLKQVVGNSLHQRHFKKRCRG